MAVLCHQYHNLPLGRGLAVFCIDRPAVFLILENIGFSHIDHGLNGENHTKTAPFERPVSMLFQENNLFTHLSVEENIALGLKPNLALNAEEKALVEQAASAVNLQDFLTRKPTALSGGQKQRVALARCLLRDKPILLLDEPFSALDPKLRIEMQDLMDQLCEEKKLTMLLVTHQPKEIERHIDRVIEIHQGKVI